MPGRFIGANQRMGGQATQPVFQPDSYPLSNDLTITRWSHAACFTLVAWARRQPSQLSHGSLWGWSATGDNVSCAP